MQLRQAGGGGRVAGDEDELDVLPLEVAPDLQGKSADVVQRTRAVRQAGVVAEVDEILVRHRHQALVEDREPARARVEDTDGPRVHRAIVRGCEGVACDARMRGRADMAARPLNPAQGEQTDDTGSRFGRAHSDFAIQLSGRICV